MNSAQDFQHSNFLSPSFFESDFNGDGENDFAIPVVNEDKFGIVIFLENDSLKSGYQNLSLNMVLPFSDSNKNKLPLWSLIICRERLNPIPDPPSPEFLLVV